MRFVLIASLALVLFCAFSNAANSKFADLDDDLFGDDSTGTGGGGDSGSLDLGEDDLFGDGGAGGGEGAGGQRGGGGQGGGMPPGQDISKLDPDTIDAELENPRTNFVARGIKFAESGNDATALRYFRAALKFDEKNPNNWLNLGTCLMNKAHAVARKQIPRGRAQKKLYSELNEAVQAFNTGLSLKPRRADQGLLIENRKIALRGLHEIFPRKCQYGICEGADTSPLHGEMPEKFKITKDTVGSVKTPEELEKLRRDAAQQGGQQGGQQRGQRRERPMDDEFGDDEELGGGGGGGQRAPPQRGGAGGSNMGETDDDMDFLFEDPPAGGNQQQQQRGGGDEDDASGDDGFDFGGDSDDEPPKAKSKPAAEESDHDTWDL